MAQALNQIDHPVLLRFVHAGIHRNAHARLEIVFSMRAVAALDTQARIVGLQIHWDVMQIHLHTGLGQRFVQRLLADA